MIDWFMNTTPFYFCIGLIGLAVVFRVIYEILSNKG